jgi:hypothetical protein
MTNIDFFPHCDETGEQCRRERNPTIHVDLPATNTRALMIASCHIHKTSFSLNVILFERQLFGTQLVTYYFYMA